MRFAFARRRALQGLAPCFGFYFVTRDRRLFLDQQFQLQIAQRFALRTQLLNAPLPQLFSQRLDFQLRPVRHTAQAPGQPRSPD